MKIEVIVKDEKLQDLLDACSYATNVKVDVDGIKKAIHDSLMSMYKTGMILKSREENQPVIDEGIIEVK